MHYVSFYNKIATISLGVMLTLAMAVFGYSPADTVFAFDIHEVLISGKNAKTQQPIKETWQIVHNLKTHGYPLYIFSNINEAGYLHLRAKFPKHFALFEGYHTYNRQTRPFLKPQPQAYNSCKALIAERHAGKQIIFIDDQLKNIQAAHAAGIKGIQFNSGKQLQQELKPLLR